uniref:Uncharacterized protein n=1 Tax=Ralstonia solanacearum TaxID=305 RepID=A0A0S4TRE2_RALSL|nr:conserved protein of unknown function [Ralstonia solanacearum]
MADTAKPKEEEKMWKADIIRGRPHEKRLARGQPFLRAECGLLHHLRQRAALVLRSDDRQADRLDLAGLAFATELDVACLANRLGSLARGLEPFAGVELVGVFGQELAHRAGHRQADVGVDVDLAHAVLDGFLDFLDRHAVGFLHLAAVLVDDGQQLLRHARRAVHHQVGVGDARVDFLDAADRQDVAGGLARELVGAMAGADGDGQGVELGGLDELRGFLGVGQQGRMIELADGAVAIFLARLAGFQRTQAAEFTLDRHANLVRHVDHAARDVDVVVERGRGLAILAQRAVHHDRAEAQVDRALADCRALAVILVHDQRDFRIGFNSGLDQVLDEGLAGVLAGARAGLQDHRRAGFLGGFHHGLDLFQVVDVERRQAVAVFSGMVEQLAHRDEWHGFLLWIDLYSAS